MKKIKLKNFALTFFEALYETIRSLLGPQSVCIYHVRCADYAKFQLKQKPFYLAFPLILIRVLSCNPITALVRRLF